LGVTAFVLGQLVELGRVKITRPEGGGRPYFAKEDLDAYLAASAPELACRTEPVVLGSRT